MTKRSVKNETLFLFLQIIERKWLEKAAFFD